MDRVSDCRFRAMAIFSVHNKLIFANQAFFQLFGYAPSAALTGQPLESFLKAGNGELESLDWLKAQTQWAGLVSCLCRDNKPKQVYINFYTIQWAKAAIAAGNPEQGESSFYLVLFEPGAVTEEKTSIARSVYDQKMEVIANMANGLAHDLNNILTVITGYADILQESLDDADPVKKSIQLIAKAGQKANELIKQLIVIGKRFPLRSEIIDLNALINSTYEKLIRLAGADNELCLHLAEQLWRIEGDKEMLEQILNIMVINAKENLAGRGQIALSTENRSIDETSTEFADAGIVQGEYVTLVIKDNGPALSPERLAALFEPFSAMKAKDKVLGLGLAKAYAVVSQMQGYILPVSKAEQGNCVEILLPALKASMEQFLKKDKRGRNTKDETPLSIMAGED